MLYASLLLCFIQGINGEEPIWGSSVVTATEGPSPLLAYRTPLSPMVLLDDEFLAIENGICCTDNYEVGKPCSTTKTSNGFVTEIKLHSVTNRTALYVEDEFAWNTFFAPNGVFPRPGLKEPIPEASLPLTRYMKGQEGVKITFAAFVGDEDPHISLYDLNGTICDWNYLELNQGDATFCQLTYHNDTKEVWFTGVFQSDSPSYNAYQWEIGYVNSLAVYVEWTETGKAPDEKIRSYGEKPIWGSSVVTATEGPSPLLAYRTPLAPIVKLDDEDVEIEKGICFVKWPEYSEVGKPCLTTNTSDGFVTEIKLHSVKNRIVLYVSDEFTWTTYFAPDGEFPRPGQSKPIPKASLPLTRFMRGQEEVNITFAVFVGDEKPPITLYDVNRTFCDWGELNELYEGDASFCQLTYHNDNKEVWFTGVFQRGNASCNVYSWEVDSYNYLSVYVDWTETGNAPEDSICSH